MALQQKLILIDVDHDSDDHEGRSGVADNGYLQTVIVLSEGLSHERDVSLRSGRRVTQALRSRGIEVVESDVDSSCSTARRGYRLGGLSCLAWRSG